MGTQGSADLRSTDLPPTASLAGNTTSSGSDEGWDHLPCTVQLNASLPASLVREAGRYLSRPLDPTFETRDAPAATPASSASSTSATPAAVVSSRTASTPSAPPPIPRSAAITPFTPFGAASAAGSATPRGDSANSATGSGAAMGGLLERMRSQWDEWEQSVAPHPAVEPSGVSTMMSSLAALRSSSTAVRTPRPYPPPQSVASSTARAVDSRSSAHHPATGTASPLPPPPPARLATTATPRQLVPAAAAVDSPSCISCPNQLSRTTVVGVTPFAAWGAPSKRVARRKSAGF